MTTVEQSPGQPGAPALALPATLTDGDRSTAMAIESDGLTKRFGKATVVDELALRVPAGAVFGFLGPNGSGKTTTIRMLLGLLSPDAGEARLLGELVQDRAALPGAPPPDRE